MRLTLSLAAELLSMTSWPLLASALLILGAWLVSNHYPPWVTAHSELLAALAFVVTLCVSASH